MVWFIRTVWKFQNFYAVQILREINFRNLRNKQRIIFAILDALDFEYSLPCLRAEIYQKLIFRVSEIAKVAVF